MGIQYSPRILDAPYALSRSHSPIAANTRISAGDVLNPYPVEVGGFLSSRKHAIPSTGGRMPLERACGGAATGTSGADGQADCHLAPPPATAVLATTPTPAIDSIAGGPVYGRAGNRDAGRSLAGGVGWMDAGETRHDDGNQRQQTETNAVHGCNLHVAFPDGSPSAW
jgi:hypothetical protein